MIARDEAAVALIGPLRSADVAEVVEITRPWGRFTRPKRAELEEPRSPLLRKIVPVLSPWALKRLARERRKP